jgi:carboxypeptidase Taq
VTGPVERFHTLWGEIVDLGSTMGLLAWDQETFMPPAGHEGRSRVQATLAGLRHEKLCASELGEVVERCAELAEAGSELEAEVREARRILRRRTRIPTRLAREKAAAVTLGHSAWEAARRARDFSLFAPALEQLLALTLEEADHLREDGASRYDALLEEYEPGAREQPLAELLDGLAAELTPLVRAAAASGRVIDATATRGDYPAERQLAFARAVSERFGFDFRRGRIDRAPHPFCNGFSPSDVRLTWRFDERDFRPGVFGLWHETGHGLYEQGLPPAWWRTPIGDSVSLGVHESQSRLWENLVGRSRPFWEWALPLLREHFPAAGGLTLERLLPLLHSVEPSLIRVEADQGTYDLHVCVRFALERALVRGDLPVADLPAAWDDAYERRLGLRPGNPAEGVLQDIHWSMGAFGYFPTYTLGNLIAAQLMEAARAALGDLDGAFARGDFAPLLGWLREHVHGHGSRYPAGELIQRATGAPLGTAPYLAQRRANLADVYGVRVP